METDILGGVQLNFKTILVLSGGTRREDLQNYAFRPDKVVESLADLHHEALAREFLAGDRFKPSEAELPLNAPKTKHRPRRRRPTALPISS